MIDEDGIRKFLGEMRSSVALCKLAHIVQAPNIEHCSRSNCCALQVVEHLEPYSKRVNR